ncbi:MAG: hypothetical protein L7W43_10715 [Rubripirellula sp.]|nr:hypothetical protein [Rubripirellula sp.]
MGYDSTGKYPTTLKRSCRDVSAFDGSEFPFHGAARFHRMIRRDEPGVQGIVVDSAYYQLPIRNQSAAE